METKYKLSPIGVVNIQTGANIPNSPGNRAWIEYQEWLAQGNTPLPILSLEDKKNLKRGELEDIRNKKVDLIVNGKVSFDIAKAIYLLDKTVRGVATSSDQMELEKLRNHFEQVVFIDNKKTELLSRVESAIDEEDLSRIIWETT